MTTVAQLKDDDEMQVALRKLYPQRVYSSIMRPFVGARYMSKASGHIKVMFLAPFLRGVSFGLKDAFYNEECLNQKVWETKLDRNTLPQVKKIFDDDLAAMQKELNAKENVQDYLSETESGLELEDIAFCSFIQRPISIVAKDKEMTKYVLAPGERISIKDREKACLMLEKVLNICKPDVVILMAPNPTSEDFLDIFGVTGLTQVFLHRSINFRFYENATISKIIESKSDDMIAYWPNEGVSQHIASSRHTSGLISKNFEEYGLKEYFFDLRKNLALPSLRNASYHVGKYLDEVRTDLNEIQKMLYNLLEGSSSSEEVDFLTKWSSLKDPCKLGKKKLAIDLLLNNVIQQISVNDVRHLSSRTTPERTKKKKDIMRKNASSYIKPKKSPNESD